MSSATDSPSSSAAVGVPAVSYLLALHHLVASTTPAAIVVVSVLVFTTINFALVIVPFAFLEIRPRRTERAIRRFKDWIISHERRIAAAVALFRGRIHGDQRHLAAAELTKAAYPHSAERCVGVAFACGGAYGIDATSHRY